jgi:hypothetical protein
MDSQETESLIKLLQEVEIVYSTDNKLNYLNQINMAIGKANLPGDFPQLSEQFRKVRILMHLSMVY